MRENDSAGPQHSYKKSPWGVGPMFPRFTEKNIGDDRLGQIIDSARLAPSEWNLQSKRWIVVRADAAKEQLETATYLRVPLSCGARHRHLFSRHPALGNLPRSTFKQWLPAGKSARRRVASRYGGCAITIPLSAEVAWRTALADAFLSVGQFIRGAADYGVSAYCIAEFDEAQIKTHFHVPNHFLVAALLL